MPVINISRMYCAREGVSDALRYPAQRDIKPIVVYNCTPVCNLHCVHCYSSSEACAQAAIMSTDQAMTLIGRA